MDGKLKGKHWSLRVRESK